MDKCYNCYYGNYERYIGQTITVFTASGGVSGGGFTGVLLSFDDNVVRLIVNYGSAPASASGSDCYDFNGYNSEGCGNPLPTIVTIPIDAIVAITHYAI